MNIGLWLSCNNISYIAISALSETQIDTSFNASPDHHIGECALIVKIVREMVSVLVN